MKLDPKTQQELKQLGVQTLYLFGSRALGQAGPLSDFDFAVLMKDGGHHRGDHLYGVLYDLFSPLCPRTLANDVIDIVFLRDAALELRMHVIRYGKVLLDDDLQQRLHFEEKTILEYCDFRPLLDQIDQTILASV